MQEKVVELVKYIVSEFAENKDEVKVSAEPDEGGIVRIVITADHADLGRIIGKQGRIAKSIRTIVRAMTQRENDRYVVEIED